MSENTIFSQFEKSQVDDFRLTSAQQSLHLADSQNQNLSTESRKQYDAFYDKILMYSAGAFSFSIALIGLVVDDKTAALSKIGFIFPNVFWLHFSLIAYLTTCALVLWARRLDADYLAFFGMRHYLEAKVKEQRAMLTKLQNYPGQVLVPDSSREEEINLCENNIKLITPNIEKNKQAQKNSFKIKRACHFLAEITVIIASISLLIFSIAPSKPNAKFDTETSDYWLVS